MTDVTFVFTNPRHHLEMMAPVARVLRDRGHACRMVSFAELRGFQTPRDLDLPLRVAIPLHVRRSPKMGSGIGRSRPGVRHLVRAALARILVPIARRLVGQTRVLVVPNDTAFPYDRILAAFPRTPSVLLQEGIRFAMPNGDAYGTGPTTRICAWGEGSRDFFASRGASEARIAVTGSPRHDHLDRASWTLRGEELVRSLGLARRPLVLMTNPIETQGFGTKEDRLALFRRFVTAAAPVLRARELAVVVKNHAFEASDEYASIAAQTPARDLVHVDRTTPLFAAIVASCGAIVMTSTAGLEAQALGAPLAVLELPRGGYAFEYVERGAAQGLRANAFDTDLARFLDEPDALRSAADALVARHFHARGHATANVAAVIEELVRRPVAHARS